MDRPAPICRRSCSIRTTPAKAPTTSSSAAPHKPFKIGGVCRRVTASESRLRGLLKPGEQRLRRAIAVLFPLPAQATVRDHLDLLIAVGIPFDKFCVEAANADDRRDAGRLLLLQEVGDGGSHELLTLKDGDLPTGSIRADRKLRRSATQSGGGPVPRIGDHPRRSLTSAGDFVRWGTATPQRSAATTGRSRPGLRSAARHARFSRSRTAKRRIP